MITQEDLQPESIIRNVFTLQKKSALTQDSYSSLLIRLAALVFICLLVRMVLVGMAFNLIILVLALACLLLLGFFLILLLEQLSRVKGTKNTLVFGLVLAFLAFLVLVI